MKVARKGLEMSRYNKRKIKDTIITYGILTLASLIMILGIYVFKFPNNYSFGGVSGIAIVFSAIMPFSAGTINLVINMSLLVIGFVFLGRGFGIMTTYVSILMSVGLSFMEKVFPLTQPLTNEPVLELIFAIFLPAFSSAIMFNIGASSGGTDIVAMIMKKYTKMSNIGTPLFLIDLMIVIMACFVFDIKTGLFSLTGLLAKSLVIDSVIENINLCKHFTIVCNEPEPICDYIHNQLKRSATIFEGEGTYEHKKRYIILTVMKRGQAVELRNYIRAKEPNAFITIMNSSEIIGKGFRGLN